MTTPLRLYSTGRIPDHHQPQRPLVRCQGWGAVTQKFTLGWHTSAFMTASSGESTLCLNPRALSSSWFWWSWGGRDQRILGAHWPVSLANQQVSGSWRNSASETKMQGSWRRHPAWPLPFSYLCSAHKICAHTETYHFHSVFPIHPGLFQTVISLVEPSWYCLF